MADDKAKHRADVKAARDEGFQEGLDKGRREILDFLQRAYIEDEGRPDRGSPEARAILEVANKVAKHIQKLPKGKV